MFSLVQLFATTWIITVHGILQATILEWVAFPFSGGSSQFRDRTQVSHIVGGFFTSWATRGSPRLLEWDAYPFSRGSSRPRNRTRVSCIAGGFFINWAIREALVSKGKLLSRLRLFASPWNTQSLEFSSPENWSGEPFPSPRDLPNPGIEPGFPTLQTDSLPAEPQEKSSILNYNNRIITLKSLGCF